jgi:hypothetical protein
MSFRRADTKESVVPAARRQSARPIFRTCGGGLSDRRAGGGLSRSEDLEEELLDGAGLGESGRPVAGADGGEV